MKARLWLTRTIELVVLGSFAFAQPLFDLLGHQATFFVAHRAGAGTIVSLAALLLFGPPLVLLAGVTLAARFSESAARFTHATFLGALAGLTVAPPLARTFDFSASTWTLATLIVAGFVIWLHERWPNVQRAASWALVAPAGFAAAFVLGSPVRELVMPSASAGPQASGVANVPVVMLVLDEFPLGAILRADGAIDAVRFPNFARLAAESTWYPNATTNGDGTVYAIPALLTGSWLREERLPTAQAHPNNLLTYFGRAFPIDASEFVTAICAGDVCDESRASGTLQALARDTAVVYLHAALPKAAARRWLPSVSSQWTGFGREIAPGTSEQPTLRSMIDEAVKGDEAGRMATFVSRLAATSGPKLWYLHLGLPHVPWHYLPTGQAYNGASVAGLTPDERWQHDERAVDHGLQRFLLQLTYVDHLVGDLLDRLHATKLDERALVVVVADHGASFRASTARRDFDPAHPADVLPIPFFVRYPGQGHGAIDPRNAELVDVLPTIASVLEMSIPWAMDGHSLTSQAATRLDKHLFTRLHGVAAAKTPIGGRQELSARIETLFGPPGQADDLYRIGPYPELIGRVALPSAPSLSTSTPLHVEQAEAFRAVDPAAPVLPAMLTATIPGGLPAGTPVAVALNNVIAGLGWTIETDEESRISIMLVPRFFKRGENDVAIYRVMPGATLSPVGRLDHRTYRLVTGQSGGAVSEIVAPDDRVIPVRAGTYQGHVDRFVRSGPFVQFSGWAADPPNRRVPNLFLVTQRGQVVTTALPWSRPDVSQHFKAAALTMSGISVSTAALPDDMDVEVYAIFGDSAYRMPVLTPPAAPSGR